MKKTLKLLINSFLSRTINYRLVHEQTATDTSTDVWRSLYLSGFRPQVIVDVGAARGSWSKCIVDVFPSAKVLMIDPLAENSPSLRKLSTTYPSISFWEGAIGRKNGFVDLQVHSDQTSMFSSEWGGMTRKVPLRSLDSFKFDETIPRMDALKIDVQGAELEVLHGSTELLKTCTAIQLEVSFRRVYKSAPLAHDIVTFLSEKGFRMFDICDAFKRRKDRALVQADFFFVSDDRFFIPETYQG